MIFNVLPQSENYIFRAIYIFIIRGAHIFHEIRYIFTFAIAAAFNKIKNEA
jgi:hypothetical protein